MFNKIDDFFHSGNLQFYSLPPECGVIFQIDTPIEDLFAEIDTYFLKRRASNRYLYSLYTKSNIEIIKKSIQLYMNEDQSKNLLYEDVSQFIDSWGLGLALDCFVGHIWDFEQKNNEQKKLYDYVRKTLIPYMLHPNMMGDRWNSSNASSEYSKFLKDTIPEYYEQYLKKNTNMLEELNYKKVRGIKL